MENKSNRDDLSKNKRSWRIEVQSNSARRTPSRKRRWSVDGIDTVCEISRSVLEREFRVIEASLRAELMLFVEID